MKQFAFGVLLATTAFASSSSEAGPYGNTMVQCLAKAASHEDHTAFVKWVFGVLVVHPDLESMSTISARQRDDNNKKMAAVLQRLLVESCGSETKQAIQHEGTKSLEDAFGALVDVAMDDVLSDPHVDGALDEAIRYIDMTKLESLTTPAPAK